MKQIKKGFENKYMKGNTFAKKESVNAQECYFPTEQKKPRYTQKNLFSDRKKSAMKVEYE